MNELLVEGELPPSTRGGRCCRRSTSLSGCAVHFYNTDGRGARGRDRIAEDAFPFIAREPRFSLKGLVRSVDVVRVTKDWDDFDIDRLADPPELFAAPPSVTVLYDPSAAVSMEVDNLGCSTRAAAASPSPTSRTKATTMAAGNGGVSYEAARSFTVVRDDKLEGTAAFAAAYEAVGLKGSLASRACRWSVRSEAGYKVFARFRTDVTRGMTSDRAA